MFLQCHSDPKLFFNLPRSQKYVLSKTIDGKAYHVHQLKACHKDPTRLKRMKKYVNNSSGWFDVEADIEHDLEGNIFRSTPIVKLVSKIFTHIVPCAFQYVSNKSPEYLES